jgi:hypothetical protein
MTVERTYQKQTGTPSLEVMVLVLLNDMAIGNSKKGDLNG